MELKEHAYTLLKEILENSFDEIFITDAIGNIVYTRQSREALFGIPHEKMLDQNVFQLEKEGIFSPSIIVNVLKNKKEETLIQETKNQRKLITSGYPIFDETNRLIGAVSFSRDITEIDHLKKENEQVAKAIQQYREEIAESEKTKGLSLYLKK